jgi:threonine 3-dehydrogenase
MSILITGGSGLTGSRLVSVFLDRGEKVVIFNRSLAPSRTDDTERFIQVRGDVTSWHEVMNVVRDHHIDNIFHLAAMLTVSSEANPWGSINTNAIGTYNVLEAARLFGVRKVIFTSSIGAYGVAQDTVVTEDTPQRPTNIYGCCKVFGELLGLYYHRKFGIDFRGIRVPQIVGPGVKNPGIGQYHPWLIEAAIKGEPFEVWAPEDTVMPMLSIKDVIESLVMLYDAPEDRIITRVYNMGQITPPPSAKELADAVKKYYPEARITFKPDPALMPIIKTVPRVFKGDKAEEEWGWKPSYSLDDMVKDFIDEFKNMQNQRPAM